MTDSVVMSVIPNVELELDIQPSAPTSHGSFLVTGPARAISKLERIDGYESSMLSGQLSPRHDVTLPPAAKQAAGIPLEASSYAFVYPMSRLQEGISALRLNLAVDSWAFVLLVGGFVYFGDAEQVIAVNALTVVESAASLTFVGPYPASPDAVAVMKEQQRGAKLDAGPLASAGMRWVAWVHPGELLGESGIRLTKERSGASASGRNG